MKSDSLFYRLFQDYPGLVFELGGLPLPADAGYILRAEKVKQTGFRLDGVLLPPETRPELPWVFVEVQFRQDPEFYGRWFSAILLFLYRHSSPHPWRAVAIFPSRAVDMGRREPFNRFWSIPGFGGCIWKIWSLSRRRRSA